MGHPYHSKEGVTKVLKETESKSLRTATKQNRVSSDPNGQTPNETKNLDIHKTV